MRYSDHEQRQMDIKSGEELDRRAAERKAKEDEPAVCELCGKPMPPGEEMFKYHGYSGPCPVDEVAALVARQAEDDGLWFVAQTAAEAYLQQELRRLHAAIEGKSPEECARTALGTTLED
jgi:hypothetical protein